MGAPDDLDELTSLLSRCLGRIEEQATRLHDEPTEGVADLDAASALEDEADRLQRIVDSILRSVDTVGGARADLNRAVSRVVDAAVRSFSFPLVVRTNLTESLSQVLCAPGPLAAAIDRAVVLAADHAGAGGEITVATRNGGDDIAVRISARGRGQRLTTDRVSTLQEFIAELGGRCSMVVDKGGLLTLVIGFSSVLEREGG